VDGFKKVGEEVIYFLAEHLESKVVRLLYYRTNPWRDKEDEAERQNNIKLVPGEIKLPLAYNFVTNQEAILLKKETSQGLKLALIIQYYRNSHNIHLCFIDGEREPELLIQNHSKYKALPLTI